VVRIALGDVGKLIPAGPAQSDFLIHFCGRPPARKPTPDVPDPILKLTPSQRLSQILGTGQLQGFPPFGAEGSPAVCFSESPPDHLVHLLQQGWTPWGLVFRRDWVFGRGGGPAWYMRTGDFGRLREVAKPWAVRLETDSSVGFSDWTHEREWRVPVDPGQPRVALRPGDVVAVLIGEAEWEPDAVESGYYLDQSWNVLNEVDLAGRPELQAEPWLAPPPIWQTAEKWLWDFGSGAIRQL
jgi:hypothetical protein